MQALKYLGGVFCVVLIAGSMLAEPTAKPVTTMITVPDLHCAGCAKKVTGKLQEVAGVAKAEADIEAKTMKVTHMANATPSPKALWEAVEKAKKTPSKLEGPSGTFTDKPKE